MNLIRKYKIHKITPVLNDKELKLINFIEDKLKDLILFKTEKLSESTFYMKLECEWVLDIDTDYKKIWINGKNFWNILEDEYEMKNDDIIILLKYMIEKTLKIEIVYPLTKLDYSYMEICSPEEEFKIQIN